VMAHRKTVPIHEETGELALTIPCAECKAEVGDPCTDTLGRAFASDDEGVMQMHFARITPILVAYRAGQRKGRRDMKEELNRGKQQD